ncbi:hypothetical protein BDV93DRAFT_522880 [Ceratobasidium sp. AG-I]|nr:hypothetical protein BDV93DRAFT_522880 [Ceratobasidium sp. AG-I]
MDDWSSVSDSLPDDILIEKANNSKISINRLPPELLSQIFAIGDGEQRSKRLGNERYYGIQDIAVQICSHWRDVAINSPALWSYVYISQAPPHRHALVYLARSGTTVPLVIDIEMMDRPVDAIDKTLRFLTSHGATANRWRSFIFCSNVSDILLRAMRAINIQLPRALQLLSIKWKDRPYYLDYSYHSSEASELDSPPSLDLLNEQHTILDPRLSQLRSVDLDGALTGDMFDLPAPLASGLTHLSLAMTYYTLPLDKLCTLLSSNPQLQSLVLSASAYAFKPTSLRVHLPILRSLSLNSEFESSWALAVIEMIAAPAVERLQLAMHFSEKTVNELIEQLTTGASEERIAKIAKIATCLNSRQPIPYKTIYPLLWDLSIEPANRFIPDKITHLFAIFSRVTRLFLPGWAVQFLSRMPLVLPNLKCISTGRCYVLDEVVRCRIEAGFPVKRVEMGIGSLKGMENEWPDSVEAVERPNPLNASGRVGDYDDYDDYDNYYNGDNDFEDDYPSE